MEISFHDSYVRRLSSILPRWLKRRSRPLDPLWLEAALILLRLDLDPFRDDLARLYSPSARGQPPFDPVSRLRSLLLMLLIGYSSIDKFAKRLRRSKRLAILAGFEPSKTPSVGAFHAFLDRLEDGPYQPPLHSPGQAFLLLKSLKDNGLDAKIEAAAYDAGHDATGIYEYLIDKRIKPVIALNHRSGQPDPSGTADQVNKEGVPVCVAGLAMRRHAKTADGRIYYNCPVKRPTHILGKSEWKSYEQDCPRGVLCQPQTKMGPVVYVRSEEDVRLYPEIARDSPLYKQIMNQRTGCERSNSTKKVTYHLGERPCRAASHYLMRLYFVSLIEHARAWVAEDRKKYGSEIACLLDLEKMKQAAPT